MSAAQHTPGPWHACDSRVFAFPFNRLIADVCPEGIGAGLDDEDRANRDLIAALPELLEVARLLVGANCPEAVAFATQRAHAALAKAQEAAS